jgi:hypothetical protein
MNKGHSSVSTLGHYKLGLTTLRKSKGGSSSLKRNSLNHL